MTLQPPDWMPSLDDWGQASQTNWLGQHHQNALEVYRLEGFWCWRVTCPNGFTMSGIKVPELGQALCAAEQASQRLLNIDSEPTDDP